MTFTVSQCIPFRP